MQNDKLETTNSMQEMTKLSQPQFAPFAMLFERWEGKWGIFLKTFVQSGIFSLNLRDSKLGHYKQWKEKEET